MFHFYEKVRETAIVSIEKIALVEGKEIIKTDQANAKMLNNFFNNIIKNLEIPQYNQIDPICQNITDPVIKTIIKYRNHPGIIAIKPCVQLTLRSNFLQLLLKLQISFSVHFSHFVFHHICFSQNLAQVVI